MKRDSVLGTIGVAAGLCIVCSVLVSASVAVVTEGGDRAPDSGYSDGRPIDPELAWLQVVYGSLDVSVRPLASLLVGQAMRTGTYTYDLGVTGDTTPHTVEIVVGDDAIALAEQQAKQLEGLRLNLENRAVSAQLAGVLVELVGSEAEQHSGLSPRVRESTREARGEARTLATTGSIVASG